MPIAFPAARLAPAVATLPAAAARAARLGHNSCCCTGRVPESLLEACTEGTSPLHGNAGSCRLGQLCRHGPVLSKILPYLTGPCANYSTACPEMHSCVLGASRSGVKLQQSFHGIHETPYFHVAMTCLQAQPQLMPCCLTIHAESSANSILTY